MDVVSGLVAAVRMVSVIAKNLKDRRQHKALCDLFDKADVTKDGTISIQEYLAICEEYGVVVTPENIKDVEAIADENGEVHRNDFIFHLKNSNMIHAFESADPESDFTWKKKADLAFKLFDQNGDGFVNKKEFKWMTTNAVISKKQIDITFKRCDLDGDGKLNYSEFRRMMFRQKERCEGENELAKELEKKEKETKGAKNAKNKKETKKPKGKSKKK